MSEIRKYRDNEMNFILFQLKINPAINTQKSHRLFKDHFINLSGLHDNEEYLRPHFLNVYHYVHLKR